MDSKTTGFKSATNKVASLSELFAAMDKMQYGYFDAHFDPFEYGQDLCGFSFPPNSAERNELSNLLYDAGIRHSMVGQFYIFIKPESADIARELFTGRVRGRAPSAVLEQKWAAFVRAQNTK